MKKFLLLLICFASTFVAVNAQNSVVLTPLKSVYGAVVDTVKSDTARYLYAKTLKGFYKVVSITVTGTEISGTTAGTATLEASIDSVSWYPADIDTGFTFTDKTGAQSYRWKLTDWGDSYFRIKVVGVGTTNFKIKGSYIARREQMFGYN